MHTDTAVILRSIARLTDRLDTATPPPMPKLLTLREAADCLGVSSDTVKRLCDRRQLQYVQAGPGTARRIPLDAVRQWIDAHSVRPISEVG